MSAVRTSMAALLVLAGCGGTPFPSGPGGVVSSTSVNELGDKLSGPTSPTATGAIARRERANTGPGLISVTGNGAARGFVLNDDGTFTVDNLGFDGGNVYQPDGAVSVIPGTSAQVFAADGTFQDSQTGALIDQFSYRALYGVSASGHTKFAIVRTGAYTSYGFGGFIYSRDQGVTLPTTKGQAHYSGSYAGIRDFDNATGLQYTSGDMNLAIDFNATDKADSKTGNGSVITGKISNRHIFDLDGNDITQTVMDEISQDKNTDAPLTELPTLDFNVGPGVLDNNGEAQGSLGSCVVVAGICKPLEAGKYYAVISGDSTAGTDEVAGVIVVNSTVSNVVIRETGGFLLSRQ